VANLTFFVLKNGENIPETHNFLIFKNTFADLAKIRPPKKKTLEESTLPSQGS
jgi:hypothetical protein